MSLKSGLGYESRFSSRYMMRCGIRTSRLPQSWLLTPIVALWVAAWNLSIGYAGRPLVVDDAEPVAPGDIEIEAGFRYMEEETAKHYDSMIGVALGLFPRVEAGLGFGGRASAVEHALGLEDGHESGLGDLSLGVKIKFLDSEHWLGNQAIVGNVKLPTADEERGLGTGEVDYDLTWILSVPITPELSTDVNAGYTWIGPGDHPDVGNLLHYGVAFGYAITDRLQAVAEAHTFGITDNFSDTAVIIDGGVRWRAWKNLVFDAAIGSGVRGPAPEFLATIGLTWTAGLWKPKD